jgi:predicted ArsR family transcriptional regulator
VAASPPKRAAAAGASAKRKPAGAKRSAAAPGQREQDVLRLVRERPGITVAEMANDLGMTGMGIRRHLDLLAADGLVEPTKCPRKGVGRPATGWRLSPRGLELFPRRYDALTLDVLEDLVEQVGSEGVNALFRRRTDKLVSEYEARLESAPDLEQRVAGLTAIRDEAGYLAEWSRAEDGELVLTENNCAVHRVAQRYPAVCAMELNLIRRVLGPDVSVTRVAHTMAGDAVCAYCIRPKETN